MQCAGAIAEQSLSAPADYHQVLFFRQLGNKVLQQPGASFGFRIDLTALPRNRFVHLSQSSLIQIHFTR
jgi:hypothetical protein